MTHQEIKILIDLVEKKLNDNEAGLTNKEKKRLSYIKDNLKQELMKINTGGLTMESVTQILNLVSLFMKFLMGDS